MTDRGGIPRAAARLLADQGMDLHLAAVLVALMHRHRLITAAHNAPAVARLVWDWCRVDGVNAHVSEVRGPQMLQGRSYVSDVQRGLAR